MPHKIGGGHLRKCKSSLRVKFNIATFKNIKQAKQFLKN